MALKWLLVNLKKLLQKNKNNSIMKIKKYKMEKFKLFVLLLLSINLFLSCGKPTTPETVPIPDISGGYKIVTKYATSGYAQDVLKKDDLLYIAQGEGGLEIVDIADPENPETVSIASEGVRGYSIKVAILDTVVYIAAGSFGVTVLDVADVYNPIVTAANTSMKPAKNIHIRGQYLFTAVSEQGVKLSNISYPAGPDPQGAISTFGFAYDLTTTADSSYMFVACGEMGLDIINISDFQGGWPNYWQVGWCDTPGKAESIAILEEESIAFLACGTAGLQIIHYADTTNIHIIGSLDGGGYAKDLIYKDQRIYQTAELGGLQIIDVSDYTNPQLIGVVDTEFALGLDIDDNFVYVADEDEGLIIISIPL